MADEMSKAIHHEAPLDKKAKFFVAIAGLAVAAALSQLLFEVTAPRARDDGIGELATLADRIATIPCEYAISSDDFERKGLCSPTTHGVVVIKSDAGLDFIETNPQLGLLASVYYYDVDGKQQRRVWSKGKTGLADAREAFGTIR